MWKEVEKFEKSGDTDKLIKVSVSDLIEIRENLIDFEWKAIKYEKKISELSKNQTSEMKIRSEKQDEALNLVKQKEIDELKRMIEDKTQLIDTLNQKIYFLSTVVEIDQIGVSDQGAHIAIDTEIRERDAEIIKLQNIISDLELNNRSKDLSSLEIQLEKLKKDAQTQIEILELKNQELFNAKSLVESQLEKIKKDIQVQAEILEFKNQELVDAETKIKSQKAEFNQALIEFDEERKRMVHDLALQKESSSTEQNMQKSAMKKIETENNLLQDKIIQKDLKIEELNRVVTKFKFQTHSVDLTEMAKKDEMIAQLKISLKKAEYKYNESRRKIEKSQIQQSHVSKLRQNAVCPAKRNQIISKSKENDPSIALFQQEYTSMVRKTKQMKGIFQQDGQSNNSAFK
ncbi:hypothetical protein NEF87_004535 [Candidatus Lokiarchaeum ossiferum]|uniref:Chromosome partition protein Smc n=1 Tax=Candidatus Lokiarchaeum ossiferum TaxID=2951803 RepID=A0ABY6HXJ2_9ARCH|nr:hypothetical protein NEF87_004535 [Candidatus Lokiarchaeum sp. B-35]